MKILIEGEYYPIKTLQNIFEDPKFYIQNGLEGKITSVGYYHSFKKNELVYMLPKVFMIDTKMSIFNKTTSELLELDSIQNVKHDKQYNWIRQSSIYFYNSLLEYRKRITDTGINKNQTFWIYRSYCATCTGHIVPRKTDVISRPNLHINL